MIKNYLKIAWRNLWKHKVYSLLNILGLSTGITACIIIMLFVFYEKSSDGIHSKNILTSKHVTAITGSRQKLGNNLDWGFSEMSVRINGRNTKEAISEIESTWKKNAPNDDFEYEFLDAHFAELYRADNTVSEIVGVLAGLAILISCLGLFGQASFSVEQRVKEIGVRKVLGTSVVQIVNLISQDFIKLVLIAFVIASPLAWYSMSKWLEDYAYRIDIPWWVFVLAGILAIAIALLTVSFQSVKAALKNPVKSLRNE